MVVRITPEMNQKLEELKKDMHSKIKDAYKVREEKEAKAEELYEESHKLQVEAINEYRKAVQSARDEFTKAQYELILNAVKDEKEKAKEDNVHKNNKTVHKPFINDPFMNLLYDILTYDVVHKDEKEETEESEEREEKASNTEDTAETKTMSLDEKIEFVQDKLSALSDTAKAYTGLHGARLVKVRNEHTCGCCGQIISAGDYAVVTHVLKNTKSGISFKELWDNDYELFIKDDKYYASTGICNIELTAHRHWITLDCAIEKIKHAEEFSE